MSKYKQYFKQMIQENQELFDSFKKTHDLFATDRAKYKDQFNAEGEKVMAIIKHYENILCNHSENVGYGKFSTNLADKFWAEVRATYPRIDFVGIK